MLASPQHGDGSASMSGVTIKVMDGRQPSAEARLGPACVVWNLPYVLATDSGWNVLLRPPSNYWRDGAIGLEGLVEAGSRDRRHHVDEAAGSPSFASGPTWPRK